MTQNSTADLVAAQVGSDFPEQLDRLLRYIRQPSISATGEGIEEMCRLLAEDARALGGVAEIVPGDEYPVVLCRFDVGAPRTVIVHTMYDVAAVGEPEWVVEPFSATRMKWAGLGECIIGRGAEDTKSQVAMIYNVIAAYRAAGTPLPVNVILVQEASELGSGSIGGFVRDHMSLLKAADVAWWPFISGLPNGTPVIYLGAKGLMTGKFRVTGGDWGAPTGTSIHGLHTNWIANPAHILIKALASMKSDDDRDVTIPGFYGSYAGPTAPEVALIDHLVEQYDPEPLLAALGVKRHKQDRLWDSIYDHCFKSEFNVSGLAAGVIIEGGHKVVIGHEAVASVDIRPVGQSIAEISEAISDHLDAHFPEVKWELQNSYTGDRVALDSWPVQRMLEAYSEMGLQPQVWPSMAAAIAVSLWTKDVGIPWIMGMPGHAGGKHGANEYIVVDGFRQSCEFGVRLLARLATD